MKKIVSGVFIFSFLVILSCKKIVTEIKQVPITHSWLSDSSLFDYNKIILSSVQVDDTTLAVFNKVIMTSINSKHLNGSIYNGAILGCNYGSLLPLSLSKRIGVFPTDSNHLRVFATTNPNWNYGGFIFSPTYSNSALSIKGFPLATEGGGYSIVNDKYILAPSEIDFTKEIAKCNLIRVDSSNGIAGSVQFGSSKDIYLTPASSTMRFSTGNYYSFSFFNKFFLTLSDQFYRIDTLGNIKAFGYGALPIPNSRVTQMFSIGNYLFAITFSDILISTDFGETWSVFKSSPGYQFIILTYQNVGNDLYAYYLSQIWKVTLSGNTLNYTELDNDGLQSNQITGVNKVGSYAFVSTLSGLYYRDTTSFNTPKK
ncbi:MAG: hypothetical protein KGL19_13680 [Bacteroidota bacterium]|nr:hypothetical protein [Bacteroidota bacterium]